MTSEVLLLLRLDVNTRTSESVVFVSSLYEAEETLRECL